MNGRPYSVHLTSCKNLHSATDSALRKHKITAAKKSEAKRLEVAARKALTAQGIMKPAASGNQGAALLDSPDSDNQQTVINFNENDVPFPLNSPSPPPRPSGRPNRQIHLPRRYRDDLPPNPPIISVSKEIVEYDDEPVHSTGHVSPEPIPIPKTPLFCTETNSFGIYRKYAFGPPTINPDESFSLSSISDSVSIACDATDLSLNSSWWSSFGSSTLEAAQNPDNFTPFLNHSTFLLMSWYYNGSSTKSYADVDKLIHNVI